MVEAARKYNRVVQAGTMQRSGIHFQKATEIVRKGELGKITLCRTWNVGNSRSGRHRQSAGFRAAGRTWIGICGWVRRPSGPSTPTASACRPSAFSTFR